MVRTRIRPRRFRAYGRKQLDDILGLRHLSSEEILAMKSVASVLPFRTNNYVVEELIDWDAVPDDPIYQLTFPQPGMLDSGDLEHMIRLHRNGAADKTVTTAAREIQRKLNPHPAGQMELNVPRVHGRPIPGMQHKYRETVLFFPSQGQTCHAYCTYCFRWAQFVGLDDLKFASGEAKALADYLAVHPEVNSVLFTGGDPMIMKTSILRRYIEPLLAPELDHVVSIRIGTKAPAYWPYRFLTDPDAGDLLKLFEEVRKAGRHLALMAHYSHPRELETPEAQAAIRRIQGTGAVIRSQAPLVRNVNDRSQTWADLWRLQLRLGIIPYYMFVERDTGPKEYFKVPLVRAHEIFRRAYRRISGLGRTVRGPSMSATPGKVLVNGITTIGDEKVFVLTFIQARDPDWVGKPFFAKFDTEASWLTDLEPAFGEKEFFFSSRMRQIKRQRHAPAWGDRLVPRREAVIFGHVEWE